MTFAPGPPSAPKSVDNRATLALVWLGALIAVLLGALILVLLTGDDESGVAVNTSSPEAISTSVPATTVAPATTEASIPDPVAYSSLVWSRIPHEELVLGGLASQMRAISHGVAGFVVVGADRSGGDSDAAVWLSPDGVNWSRVPHDEAVFGGPDDQVMTAVAEGGHGHIAVGSDWSGGDLDAAVWLSPDGVNWSRLPHDEATFGGPGDQVMVAVATGGPGLVAVGRDAGPEGAAVTIWASVDGTAWSRVTHGRTAYSESCCSPRANDISAGGTGLILTGSVHRTDRDVAAIWTSSDGIDWTLIEPDAPADGNVMINSVASVGSGFVAVGFAESAGWTDAAVWTSQDGVTWSRAPHDEDALGGDGDQVMESVASGAEGLVAVGWEGLANGDFNALVWTSLDGVTWFRQLASDGAFGGPEFQLMRGVVVADGSVIGVGSVGTSGNANAAVWAGMLPGTMPPPSPTTTATGSGSVDLPDESSIYNQAVDNAVALLVGVGLTVETDVIGCSNSTLPGMVRQVTVGAQPNTGIIYGKPSDTLDETAASNLRLGHRVTVWTPSGYPCP